MPTSDDTKLTKDSVTVQGMRIPITQKTPQNSSVTITSGDREFTFPVREDAK